MNKLLGRAINGTENEIVIENGNKIHGRVEVLIEEKSNTPAFLKKSGVIIGIIGEICEDTLPSRLEYIYDKYCSLGIKGIYEMNGFFTVVVIDEKEEAIYIVQDKNAFFAHLYYIVNNEGLYFGTCLNDVATASKIRRCVNTYILPTYLHYSFTPNNETLMQNVYKLPANCFLKYDLKSKQCFVDKLNYDWNYNTVKDETLIDMIDASLKQRIDTNQRIGFSLSGGFDSNLLFARAVNMYPTYEFNVFSYGYNSPKSVSGK